MMRQDVLVHDDPQVGGRLVQVVAPEPLHELRIAEIPAGGCVCRALDLVRVHGSAP